MYRAALATRMFVCELTHMARYPAPAEHTAPRTNASEATIPSTMFPRRATPWVAAPPAPDAPGVGRREKEAAIRTARTTPKRAIAEYYFLVVVMEMMVAGVVTHVRSAVVGPSRRSFDCFLS